VTRQNGAVRIFLYNWPIYVGAWVAGLAILALLRFVPDSYAWVAVLGAAIALTWSAVSLLVSFYIYDVSPLSSGRWVAGALGAATPSWATIHAGLDAEVDLDDVMEGHCVARLDIFDPGVMTSPSIARARHRTPAAKRASSSSPTKLALGDHSCDAIVIAFTAHEIRDRIARETFFDELRRSLRPGGKALIVEHLRDWPNFLAFGPGYLHFVSRAEWLRLASHAKLTVASETRVTPWVMALTLERPP
jgi:SAM-dependent methyltransferase